MSVRNSTILAKAWMEGNWDYQQRIPNPLETDYAAHVAALFDPMNNDLFNQFTGLLNGLIGTYVESKLFENPLAVLKKPMGSVFGNSERHIAVQYLNAHTYRADSETLLKVEKPEYSEWFYSVSEPRRYEFSWSKYELQRVFAADGYGFDDLLTATITQMRSSANYDEMNIMINGFAEADRRMGGLFRHQLSGAPNDEATAKELLKAIRRYASMMKFPTTLFNGLEIPVFESPETLVLWVSANDGVMASLDVDALSAVFQLDRANVQYRIIEIPQFPIPNVYAALTSEDFIYCRDVWNNMEPPFYNPENLTYKYYYHISQILGVNPAANCVLFGTEEGTDVRTISVSVTGAGFTPNAGTVEPGGKVDTNFQLTGNVEGADGAPVAVEPDAAIYEVAAIRPGQDDDPDTAVPLNSRTYVDAHGTLHVQKTGLNVGDVLTVTGKSVYVNPSGATTEYTAEFTAQIVAPTPESLKDCPVNAEPYIEYTDTTEEATASH